MGVSVRGLYPSLYLNVGEAYRKVGQLQYAREHLDRGRAATDALGDDAYGRMIQGGLERLASRLDE